MTKEELIARLKELGQQLNREVSLAGTKEDLALRVAELEDELEGDDQTGGDDNTGGQTVEAGTTESNRTLVLAGSEAGKPDPVSGLKTGELLTVETLATLHIDALHATKNERVVIAESGTVIRVSCDDAVALITQGLAREY